MLPVGPKVALTGGTDFNDHRLIWGKLIQVRTKYPYRTNHAKAGPFKRNDAMLDVLPVGVLVFPGTGIQENLADKAKKLGIRVMKFEKGR